MPTIPSASVPADPSAWVPRESSVVVGLSSRDITPPVGIRARNWGASKTPFATGVHRPLEATAAAFQDTSGDWHYLITADLGWWQSVRAYTDIHRPLCAGLGVEPAALLLHLVHTHAGPSLSEDDAEGGELTVIETYKNELIGRLLSACKAAQSVAAPSTITWAYGRCDLAVNRDLPCGERDVVGFNPEAEADDTVLVGRIVSVHDGSVRAVLVNYACHPTTMAWENSLLSPDFVGALRETVNASTGARCLFFQGASGDLAPKFTGGPETADRFGRTLAHSVLSTLHNMGTPGSVVRLRGVLESGAPLAVWQEAASQPPSTLSFQHVDVTLDRQVPFSVQKPSYELAETDRSARAERQNRAARLSEGYDSKSSVTHPLFVWRMGDAVVVAHPGEAYSQLQTTLRRRHPGFAVAVLNLTNGPGFMYLPPAVAYKRNRYQVWQTLVAAGSLERLIEAADELIVGLPRPRRVVR